MRLIFKNYPNWSKVLKCTEASLSRFRNLHEKLIHLKSINLDVFSLLCILCQTAGVFLMYNFSKTFPNMFSVAAVWKTTRNNNMPVKNVIILPKRVQTLKHMLNPSTEILPMHVLYMTLRQHKEGIYQGMLKGSIKIKDGLVMHAVTRQHLKVV